MVIETGGPAFPGGKEFDRGMTLRDYFAAKAMQGILAGDHPITHDEDCLEKVASAAYKQADVMLAERNK